MIPKLPFLLLDKVIKLITKAPGALYSKIGMISNVCIAAGAVSGNPGLITVSWMGSTAAHLANAEDAAKLEALGRAVDELTDAKKELEQTNTLLKIEVEHLRGNILELKSEISLLKESNMELKTSLSSLQKTISALRENISELNQFNTTFGSSLERLHASLNEIRGSGIKLGPHKESIVRLDRSITEVQRDIIGFCTKFQDTQKLLHEQQGEITEKLSYLTETTEEIFKKISHLTGIKELSLVIQQFYIAIEGIRIYQEQLSQTQAELKESQKKFDEERIKTEESRKSCGELIKNLVYLIHRHDQNCILNA